MSISDNIRALAREGLAIADIARKLGIRYQHAYNVLKGDGKKHPNGASVAKGYTKKPREPVAVKPALAVDELVRAGFALSSRWISRMLAI